jgi:hypothetical protein
VITLDTLRFASFCGAAGPTAPHAGPSKVKPKDCTIPNALYDYHYQTSRYEQVHDV